MSKLSLAEFTRFKTDGRKIVMVTAYDAPSGRLADEAGVDSILVGDSAAMTVLGHDSTLPITLDEMIMLSRAVSRGAHHPLVVADLPFGSYQSSNRRAVQSAVRLVKDGRADAIKLEGGGLMAKRAAAIVAAGIPVMGHIGLTPQSATLLGGYKVQGRTVEKAQHMIEDARALEHAGCFAVVLEAIPAPVAARITASLRIPTIGIGAGAACYGQVLVWHDLLGITAGRVPQFVQQYAAVGDAIRGGLSAYVQDVRSGSFPSARHTYAMPANELEEFDALAKR